MHNLQVLIFTALLIFVFGLFSRVSERWTITGPMVFMIVGIAVSPLGFGLFEVHPTGDLVKLVAEITLILILFVDGSLIDVKVLLRGRPRKRSRGSTRSRRTRTVSTDHSTPAAQRHGDQRRREAPSVCIALLGRSLPAAGNLTVVPVGMVTWSTCPVASGSSSTQWM